MIFQALEDEGHDPNTIDIEVTDSPAKKTTQARKAQQKKNEGEDFCILMCVYRQTHSVNIYKPVYAF